MLLAEYNNTWTWQGEPTGPEDFTSVYFSSGWAGTRGLTDNQWIRPRPDRPGSLGGSSDDSSATSDDSASSTQFVAVLRIKDPKWVVSKSLDLLSGQLQDMSESKREGCLLVGVSDTQPYPRFRIVAKAESNAVIANSVAAPGVCIFKGRDGVVCEEYRDQVLGYAGGSDGVWGN